MAYTPNEYILMHNLTSVPFNIVQHNYLNYGFRFYLQFTQEILLPFANRYVMSV
jgi:hypothetical protein